MPRRPPMCLRYAIWALAAAGNVKYDEYHDIFYRRSRQYMEADTMKGHGEVFISIQHAQTWALVAFYEAKMLLFTRSTISVANCVRLCHMMGLNRLDGDNVGMPPSLGPPITWAELEERRRIFWGVFAADSHCCISTGWPTLIDSDDIATRLPASEEAFVQDRKEEAPFLDDAIQGAQYTGFAGTIVTCQINKLVLRHIHRSKPDSRCEDLMNGSFWTRHRDLDNTLSSLFMFLPENFRLPENIRDVSALHLNMNLHAAIICIHHAAVEKAERYKLPGHVKQGSVARLRAAAEEIANLMRLTSNVTLFFKSPLSALSLYCAATQIPNTDLGSHVSFEPFRAITNSVQKRETTRSRADETEQYDSSYGRDCGKDVLPGFAWIRLPQHSARPNEQQTKKSWGKPCAYFGSQYEE
ncbi:hypothetical protein ACHAPZ_001453 [Fusarium culmorum]